MKTSVFSWLFLSLFLVLSGCTGQDDPKSVSTKFWKAVQARDMETAKQVATWDTVDYLKYLKAEKLHPERFELGDVMQGDTRAEVSTTLFTTKMGKAGVKVPGITMLVKTEQGWRVDVKKTLGSVVKHTMNNVFDQLNGLMQEGINELDKTLSESMDELGRAIEEGAKELKQELSKPIFPPKNNKIPPIQTPKGQQI